MPPSTYPRDLVGYGRKPPNAQWPGGARIAVQFVLNYEEGGENNILDGDAGIGSVAVGDHRRAAVAGQTPYEHGVDLRIWLARRLLAYLATVSAQGHPGDRVWRGDALARNGEAVAAMKEAGWEIASHGLRWIEYKDFAEAEERAHLNEAIRGPHAADRIASARLVSGRCSSNTLRARDGGGRLPLRRRQYTPTTCPTGSRGRRGRI